MREWVLNRARVSRGSFLALVAGATVASHLWPGGAFAEPQLLSATDARTMQQSGDLIILDIRTRDEWQETGLAAGAWPVSMHEADFGERFVEILQRHPAEQIALICRTGNRSDFVRSQLEAQGVTGIHDISEGMIGNGDAPGWIVRGLPVVPLSSAQADYEAARTEWASQ